LGSLFFIAYVFSLFALWVIFTTPALHLWQEVQKNELAVGANTVEFNLKRGSYMLIIGEDRLRHYNCWYERQCDYLYGIDHDESAYVVLANRWADHIEQEYPYLSDAIDDWRLVLMNSKQVDPEELL
jgi:hypothetical protein